MKSGKHFPDECQIVMEIHPSVDGFPTFGYLSFVTGNYLEVLMIPAVGWPVERHIPRKSSVYQNKKLIFLWSPSTPV